MSAFGIRERTARRVVEHEATSDLPPERHPGCLAGAAQFSERRAVEVKQRRPKGPRIPQVLHDGLCPPGERQHVGPAILHLALHRRHSPGLRTVGTSVGSRARNQVTSSRMTRN